MFKRQNGVISATLSREEISQALLYFVANSANLPSCLFTGETAVRIREDSSVYATVDLTWWIEDAEAHANGT